MFRLSSAAIHRSGWKAASRQAAINIIFIVSTTSLVSYFFFGYETRPKTKIKHTNIDVRSLACVLAYFFFILLLPRVRLIWMTIHFKCRTLSPAYSYMRRFRHKCTLYNVHSGPYQSCGYIEQSQSRMGISIQASINRNWLRNHCRPLCI